MKLYNKDYPDLVAVPVMEFPNGCKMYDIVHNGRVLESTVLSEDEISEGWKSYED